MIKFPKKDRETLKEWVSDQIREAVITGRLKPGDRLIETKLAKEMDISRLPLREAISALEKEGILRSIPYKGTYVSKFDEKEITELFTIRSALEELAVKILIEKISKDKVKKLESEYLKMEKSVKKNKYDLVDEDLRFHQTICELSENRRLLEIWMTLKNQISALFKIEQSSAQTCDYFNQTLKNHLKILEAIKNGDSLLAQKQIKNNITKGLNNLITIIQEKKDKESILFEKKVILPPSPPAAG